MCNLSIAKNLSKGGGHLKMTSSLRGGSEIMTHDDKGGWGVKKCRNGGDVICGCRLRGLWGPYGVQGRPPKMAILGQNGHFRGSALNPIWTPKTPYPSTFTLL